MIGAIEPSISRTAVAEFSIRKGPLNAGLVQNLPVVSVATTTSSSCSSGGGRGCAGAAPKVALRTGCGCPLRALPPWHDEVSADQLKEVSHDLARPLVACAIPLAEQRKNLLFDEE